MHEQNVRAHFHTGHEGTVFRGNPGQLNGTTYIFAECLFLFLVLMNESALVCLFVGFGQAKTSQGFASRYVNIFFGLKSLTRATCDARGHIAIRWSRRGNAITDATAISQSSVLAVITIFDLHFLTCPVPEGGEMCIRS